MTGTPWLLLVEDSPHDRELIVHALRQGGFPARIVEARDGAEALDVLLRRGGHADTEPEDPPCAVLMDVKMPMVNGIEVLREIKGDPHLAHVPVVMLTSSAEEADLATCYALGVNSYVVKPVEIETFFQTVLAIGRYWLVMNRSPREKRNGVAAAAADR